MLNRFVLPIIIPPKIAEAARKHLREKFLRSTVAISGGNFLVAETGSVAIVESEGKMVSTMHDGKIATFIAQQYH